MIERNIESLKAAGVIVSSKDGIRYTLEHMGQSYEVTHKTLDCADGADQIMTMFRDRGAAIQAGKAGY